MALCDSAFLWNVTVSKPLSLHTGELNQVGNNSDLRGRGRKVSPSVRFVVLASLFLFDQGEGGGWVCWVCLWAIAREHNYMVLLSITGPQVSTAQDKESGSGPVSGILGRGRRQTSGAAREETSAFTTLLLTRIKRPW